MISITNKTNRRMCFKIKIALTEAIVQRNAKMIGEVLKERNDIYEDLLVHSREHYPSVLLDLLRKQYLLQFEVIFFIAIFCIKISF